MVDKMTTKEIEKEMKKQKIIMMIAKNKEIKNGATERFHELYSAYVEKICSK